MNTKASCFIRIGMAALLSCLLCALAVCVAPHEAQAAAKSGSIYELFSYPNGDGMGVDRDVYEKADVTGDGVKDKVEIVCNWKGSGQDQFVSKSVKVNGTVIRTLKEYPATAGVITLGSGKSFIYVYEYKTSAHNCDTTIYEIKNGCLRTVYQDSKLFDAKILIGNKPGKKSGSSLYKTTTCFEKVKGNTIYLGTTVATKALGNLSTKFSKKRSYLKLAYNGEQFELKASPVKVEKPDVNNEIGNSVFVAAKKIEAVKAVGSKKTSVTIAKGKKFTVQKIQVKDKKIYVQVKAKKGGKTGWVQLGKTKLVKQRAA